MTMGLFSSHVLKQTDPSVEVLRFFLRKKNFYKEDNSPKKHSRRKEHFKLDVMIYKRILCSMFII